MQIGNAITGGVKFTPLVVVAAFQCCTKGINPFTADPVKALHFAILV